MTAAVATRARIVLWRGEGRPKKEIAASRAAATLIATQHGLAGAFEA